MRILFKSVIGENSDGFPLGCYGNSGIDNNDYYLETHYLKADEIPDALTDAKTSSELIAGLLNAYYKGYDVSKMNEDEVMRMGIYVEEEDLPAPNPNQSELPF